MPSPSHRSRSPFTSKQDSDDRHSHRSHRSRHHDDHSSSRRHRHRDHSRSRSPYRSDRHKSDRHHRHDRDRDYHHRGSKEPSSAPVILPLNARELSRRDLEVYKPMFAMYLDIQKGLFLDELPEEEIKGRWKSFIRKWNRGELAEGWYDPATLERARQAASEQPRASTMRPDSPDYTLGGRPQETDRSAQPRSEDEDEDDEYGPKLPNSGYTRQVAHSGPTMPNTQDIELKRETAMEDAIAARHESRQKYRNELRSHKAEHKYIENEIAPRAEPGTRERQLEKRREAAAANKSFAEAQRGGSPEAAPDEQLMGSGENDLAALKREKEREQRKKNERELRREEILRARAAEREERVQQYRQKEEETIGWLQALAKQRFG
ncbi:hypothetical protein N7468_004439 [Penicillium chermesinum]|uniref:Uncharacterized protein n=1 Tax=Penicillium chermesinum TaxID=63820 RepID=A0A9W9P8S3_9EURO|nr:uncharacterized protein N7468_004439 [Penicillium chermesinum]KAJ5239820.1 hypothetical protein N7468_004439 [Penicillium chermesinum]KAJ6166699.1 hypothetical protein N7470_002146 [Penicillium chermesinum]